MFHMQSNGMDSLLMERAYLCMSTWIKDYMDCRVSILFYLVLVSDLNFFLIFECFLFIFYFFNFSFCWESYQKAKFQGISNAASHFLKSKKMIQCLRQLMVIYSPSIASPVGNAQKACLPAGHPNVNIASLIWVMQRAGLEGATGNHSDTIRLLPQFTN